MCEKADHLRKVWYEQSTHIPCNAGAEVIEAIKQTDRSKPEWMEAYIAIVEHYRTCPECHK